MHRGLCYVESKFKKHLFFCLFTFLAELSQVLPTRPERAEAPSPGRALKKSPFLRTKTENAYDL